MDSSAIASGLTIDRIAIPLHIEAEGGEAIEAHVLEQLTAPAVAAASSPPALPSHDDEGDEA